MGGYGYVPGGTASLADMITGFGQQKATIAHTQAATAQAQEATRSQAQITEADRLRNEAARAALRDQQIQRQMVTEYAAPPVNSPAAPTLSPYAKGGQYITQLKPADESAFQSWVKTNSIPFDPSPTSDYDMRGYWQAQQSGSGQGTTVSKFDGKPHFTDQFKTPYHKTFSNESQYATADAPGWQGDKLIDKSGRVVADETPGAAQPEAPAPARPATGSLADPQAFYTDAIRRGMSPTNAAAAANQLFTLQQNALKLTPDQVAAEEANHKVLHGSFMGYYEQPNEQAYGQLYRSVVMKEPDLARTMPRPGPGVAPTPQELAYSAGHLGVLDTILGQRKTQAETAHIGAQTDQAAATAAQTTQATQQAAALAPSVQQKSAADAQLATLTAAGQAPIQPVDQARIAHEQTTATELHRHNVSEEGISRVNAAVAQGHLAQEQLVNGVKYGPGTAEYWAEQLTQNPDSIKELPAEMRSTVGKAFTAKTGLPLPTPLSEAAKGQETAARNALDGAAYIQKALQNPEIQKQIGPIMGRLGNAEQAVGSAVGLSPEAERLAQELRTRMRYFVFQEGKAVLGGRLPQQLMGQLESSSANPKMDPAMLQGALDGAVANAQSVMDNADKQRFGGKMRSRETRGQGAPAALTTGHKVGDVVNVRGKNVKITAVHPDNSFDGDEVKQ